MIKEGHALFRRVKYKTLLIAQIFQNIINMLIFIVFCCLCLDVQIAERDRVQQCTNDDDADNDHLWTFMGDKICVWWWRQSLLPPANFFLNIDHKCSDEDIWDICTGPCICWWFLSNCLPLFVISSLPQYWSFLPWVQLNTSCHWIANELMHPRQWKQALLLHTWVDIFVPLAKNISCSISKHTGRFFHL